MTEQAALAAEHGLAVRGQTYPIVLPSVRDPRLHLAAVIISLQILGQVAFDFRLSIAQILISIGTCALLELWIVLRRQHALVWPASALLTGNGVAFVLRVPGTEHGDWWSTQGWWIFAGTAAVALLSKYVIRFRGSHVFNPSNFGLVLCFLLLGPGRVEPLDFWWGPMSPALALALAIIVVGGFAILSRLALVGLAVSFWIVFAGVAAVVAATGHAITARWHLGPVEGLHLWTILAFSPEILVFLFFMLTDPRTVPAGSRQRVRFGVTVALVAALLVAASSTEFWAKVGVLGALTIVCAVRPLAAVVTSSIRPRPAGARCAPDRGRRWLRGRAPGGRVDHSRRNLDRREADDAAQEGSADRHPPVEGRRCDARPSERCSDRSGSPASSPGDDAASGHRVARGTAAISSPLSSRSSSGPRRGSSSRWS